MMEGYTDSELQSLVRMGEVSPCAWQVPQEGLLWPVPVQTPSWEREAKTQKPRGPTEAVKRGAVATCGPGFPDLSNSSASGPVPGRFQKKESLPVDDKSSSLWHSPSCMALHRHLTLTPTHPLYSPQQQMTGSSTTLLSDR